MKKAKWLLTVGMIVVIAASGVVAAAPVAEQSEKPPAGLFGDYTPLLETIVSQYMPGHMYQDEILQLLKMNKQDFERQLQAGKTLAQIGAERGVPEKLLVDYLAAQMTDRVNKFLESEHIDADKAEQLKFRLAEQAAKIVREVPQKLQKYSSSELLALLDIDEQTLLSELKSGKSLLDMAAERNIPIRQLTDIFVKTVFRQIDQLTESGRIPADKAEQLKARLPEHAESLLTHNPLREGMPDIAKLLGNR